jgi:phosphohistidine phosphatase SixA
MTLLIVRHAEADPRSSWDGPDGLRPLSAKGRRQASGLVQVLGDQFPIGRLVSSPSLRCIETLSPLASTLSLDLHVADSLAEGVDPAAAIDLARSGAILPNDEGTLVLCSHGDLIPEILDALRAADELDLGPQPRCQKGSTWVLEGKRGRFTTATYIPPP